MSFDQWKVLLVEDEYDSVQTISKILRHYGIAVETAHNGRECLAVMERSLPTVVVMDLMMPEMDGWQTLARIRADSHLAQVPVVAVTAYYSFDVAEDAHKAGFDGYFKKPVSATGFVQQLAHIVGE
ncbi:MAG: response regulator [Chloroflexi bacterium]|nr:response regulator [Chloroflexota bacterium]